MQVQGKRAVVTGGGSGIGLVIAQALADAGCTVLITGRTESRLVEAAATRENISHAVCDVTDEAVVVALRDRVEADGGCDLLINNAGVMHRYDVTSDFSLAKKLQEIDIDASGPVRMVHHFLPGMLRREAAIVNVSSGLAFVPFSQAPVYSGTKAFLHAYTQSLRAQLAGTSVSVVELMPPVVDTPMVAELDPSFSRMPPEELAAAFMKGLAKGTLEITPGQSSQLRFMRRAAPGFIFGQLNKQARP
ncbi:MAG: SDR family NAD(P)-dependent oxidoreductase [Deltaproteobacteria bacterium]|nr:SDR family NAD(P)-dependent oxidoreductase [Deltaproteobacteria bacterium]